MIIQFDISPEKALWQRLSGFGLNPTEWIVRRLKAGVFCAINLAEPTWVLIGKGKTSAKSWDWDSLELCEVSMD